MINVVHEGYSVIWFFLQFEMLMSAIKENVYLKFFFRIITLTGSHASTFETVLYSILILYHYFPVKSQYLVQFCDR
jgi:hypothetical protein